MKATNYHWEAKHRTQDRKVALFAVIQCWLKEADGVVFAREDLARLLPSGRLEKVRVQLLIKHMTEFFPHNFYVWRGSKLIALFVSRSPIHQSVKRNSNMIPSTKALRNSKLHRFSLWSKDASTELSKKFDSPADGKPSPNPDQRTVTKYLTQLANGTIPASKIPQMKREG